MTHFFGDFGRCAVKDSAERQPDIGSCTKANFERYVTESGIIFMKEQNGL